MLNDEAGMLLYCPSYTADAARWLLHIGIEVLTLKKWGSPIEELRCIPES